MIINFPLLQIFNLQQSTMEYWTILLQLVPIGIFVYFYFQRKFNYWAARGVKGPDASILKFGNLLDFSNIGQTTVEKRWMKEYGSIYGIYQFTTPILTVLDPELVKQVLVKDFTIFRNRDKNLFKHEYFDTNLFNSEDETWRRIRSITSPSFSTGKLRGMHKVMNQCVDKLSQYFEKMGAKSSNGGNVNVKEMVTAFTLEVISTTSFGTETSSNGELNSTNVFVQNSLEFVDFSTWRVIAFFSLPSWVNKWLKNSLGLDDRIMNFFVDLSKAIIKQRKGESGNGGKRTDLVQLLMDAFVYESELEGDNYDKLTASADNDDSSEEKEKEPKVANGSVKKMLAENEIVAQFIIFMLAGFETTATTISMALYFMSLNPHVQERLYTELTQQLDGMDVNSAEYFERVNTKLPYMDAVIKETLRRNPPLPRLQRRVAIDGYKLAGIPLEKDIEVQIPTYAIHHNPDYFPDPETFDPERFMPENRHLLVPYTYLPFGQGPRNCIGMRFAYQEMRLCLAKIVREFTFQPSPDTKVPLELGNFNLLSCKDISLNVSRR